MDLSAMMGGGTPKQTEQPAIEYTAQAASPLVSGEAKLTIGENGFTVATLFDTAEIPFAEVNAITLVDYVVTVRTDSGDYTFSRMGEWAQRFYDALCAAYNKAVLRSLFVEGKPILTANGEYSYTEGVSRTGGSAPVYVYENCVVILPPDLKARRVPLCFVSGMDKGDYALTLTLDTGESYTFSKLGYDTAPFVDAVEKQIRKLREKSLAAIKELDPALTAAQASQIAKLMPEGAAAPFGRLAWIAPSFAAALVAKIFNTRAAESYIVFKKISDPDQIFIGFRKNETAKSVEGGFSGSMAGLGGILDGLKGGVAPADSEGTEVLPPDPYFFWLIAPSPDGRSAAVEFSEADTATFVYRTNAGFDMFAKQLNRALEAINWKREVIRLSDEELRKPENADYYMAAKRTAALQFVRASFAGRVIHSSAEAWKKKLLGLWNAPLILEQTPAEQDKPIFCGRCGAKNSRGMKFCGSCGAKL